LALAVRYLDLESKEPKVVEEVLDLIDVQDGRAETLCNEIDRVFSKHNIPWDNLIAFCADRCTAMMGEKNGLQALIKERHGVDIIVVGCFCHMLATCASHAVSSAWDTTTKTETVEHFLHEVSGYFSHSSNRCHALREFQDFTRTDRRKILRLSATRWLSRLEVVRLILKQWEALKQYFQNELFELENKPNCFEAQKRKLRNLVSHFDVSFFFSIF
jgi:hypothetical protein